MTSWRTVLPDSAAKPRHKPNPILRYAPISNPIWGTVEDLHRVLISEPNLADCRDTRGTAVA